MKEQDPVSILSGMSIAIRASHRLAVEEAREDYAEYEV